MSRAGKFNSTVTQEALVKKFKSQSQYFIDLSKKINFSIINVNFDSKHIDKIIEINSIWFVFRFTTSDHSIEISNNMKFWKIRSDLKKITKNPRKKKNPCKYVPNIFDKIFPNHNKKVYFIYPIKKPYNNAVYNVDKYFIGSYEKSMKFIEEKFIDK